MGMPPRNIVYDKIQTAGTLTDAELSKALAKAETGIGGAQLDKALLDLEILGLVNVSWMTKDTRRIELASHTEEEDEVDKSAREASEKDYEASFPGADT